MLDLNIDLDRAGNNDDSFILLRIPGKMEGARIARCTYKSSTVAIPVFEQNSYEDICNQVCTRFKELKEGTFGLTYSTGDKINCLLQCDMDVRCMFMSQSILKAPFIDILVKDVSLAVEIYAEKHVGSSSTGSFGVTNEVDENEYIDSINTHCGSTYLTENWKNYISHIDQSFEGGVKDFRDKLVKYSVELGFKFVYIKNDKTRVTAECYKKLSDGCRWRVHASLCSFNGFFYIRSLNNVHTCTGLIRTEKSTMVNSRLVSSILVDQVRDKPLITPSEVVKDLKKNYGLDIAYYHAWYGKELAKSELYGDESLSYNQLSWYKDALLSTNPRSHCVLDCEPDTSRFRRLFISFGACIEGFVFCRPLLFIDGTFFKNKYKGHLLSATGKNGNQDIYPLAFAVVDAETEDNWIWFLEILSDVLAPQHRTITFISDRNNGLCEAVSKVFPSSPHSFCIHHLKQNIKAKYSRKCGPTYRDRMADLFVRCAEAPTEFAFDMHLESLKKEGGTIMKRFLEDLPLKNWANAHFTGNRYGEMTSNIAESFNSWILEERHLPITQLVDGIRIKLMKMMYERSHEAEQWTSLLCPEMEKLLGETLGIGQHWSVSRCSDHVFEVHGDDKTTVNLESRVCSCNQWQIRGFPCAHAVAAIQKNTGDIYEYVEDYFKTGFFKNSYSIPIHPIPNIKEESHSIAEEVVIKPPQTKKHPGRPRNKRIKSSGEVGLVKCSRSGEGGRHNRKSVFAPRNIDLTETLQQGSANCEGITQTAQASQSITNTVAIADDDPPQGHTDGQELHAKQE